MIGLFMTESEELKGWLKRSVTRSFTEDNLPYTMGIISIFLIFFGIAVSSAAGLNSIEFDANDPKIAGYSAAWLGEPVGAEPDLYYNFWQDQVTEDETLGWSSYYGWWYGQPSEVTGLDSNTPFHHNPDTWIGSIEDRDYKQEALHYRLWLRRLEMENFQKEMDAKSWDYRWTWVHHDRRKDYSAQDCTIPLENQPPIAIDLFPEEFGSQNPGAKIKWTAEAHDLEGDFLYYQFWLKGPATGNLWHDMTGWIFNNKWTWKTSTLDVGLNQVQVWIRDGRHAGPDECDASFVRNCPITWNTPPPC